MNTIHDRLTQVRSEIAAAAKKAGRAPDDVLLLAVSKTQPTSRIAQAWQAGQRAFGESYIQEAREKIAAMGHGPRWHFIGHLQANKARDAAILFDVIESVDRMKTAAILEKHLAPMGKTMEVLVQVNVGGEAQKSGVLPDELPKLLAELATLPHLRVQGLMTVPPQFPNPEAVRPLFRTVKTLALEMLERRLLSPGERGLELSMGMSHDFVVAIEEGASIVRVGSAIFGDRVHHELLDNAMLSLQ